MDNVFLNYYNFYLSLIEAGANVEDIKKQEKLCLSTNKGLFEFLKVCQLEKDMNELTIPYTALTLIFNEFSSVVINDESKIFAEDIPMIKASDEVELKNLQDCLKNGNPLFNSIIYLKNKEFLDTLEGFKISLKPKKIHNTSNLAYGLRLVCYVLNHLIRGSITKDMVFPKIVTETCDSFKNDFEYYLGSMSLLKRIGYEWIKHIDFKNFPTKLKNRLLMSICGYRYINCVAENGIVTDNEVLNAIYSLAKIIKKVGILIDIHPSFINEKILAVNIKLGKMMTYYILLTFEEEEIKKLEKNNLPKNWYEERTSNPKITSTKINLLDVKAIYDIIPDMQLLIGGMIGELEKLDFSTEKHVRKVNMLKFNK